MSLVQLLRIILARKWMILSVTLACLVVATTIGSMLPKRYPAEARVLLNLLRPDPVTGERIGRDSRTYVRTQIELIKDMRVAGLVVDRLGLAENPATIASYQASGRTDGIRRWLGQRIIDRTSAGLRGGSSIMTISYTSPDPDQALRVVTALREAYIDSTLRFQTDTALRTGDWYREQTQKSAGELAEAEASLSKFMQENGVVVVDGVDSELAKLHSLRGSLAEARAQQARAETASTTRLANDPVVDSLRMQLASVEDELALAGTRMGPQHPEYKAIEARRNTLLRQIQQAAENSRTGVNAVTSASGASITRLEARVAEQERAVLERKPVLDELSRLMQAVELKRNQYRNTAARTETLQLEADSSETGIVVLGDPTVSRTPSYPNVPLIMALATGGGLGLGVFASFLLEFLGRRIRGPEDLAYAIGAPVFATVAATSGRPLRYRLQRLLGRRPRDEGGTELQVVS